MPFVDVPTSGGVTKGALPRHMQRGPAWSWCTAPAPPRPAATGRRSSPTRVSATPSSSPVLQGSGETSAPGGKGGGTRPVPPRGPRAGPGGRGAGRRLVPGPSRLAPPAGGGRGRADAHMAFQLDLWRQLAGPDPNVLARLIVLTTLGKDTLRARFRSTCPRRAATTVPIPTGTACTSSPAAPTAAAPPSRSRTRSTTRRAPHSRPRSTSPAGGFAKGRPRQTRRCPRRPLCDGALHRLNQRPVFGQVRWLCSPDRRRAADRPPVRPGLLPGGGGRGSASPWFWHALGAWRGGPSGRPAPQAGRTTAPAPPLPTSGRPGVR